MPLWLSGHSGIFQFVTRSSNNPWLHRFAVCTAVATLLLIGIGGLVTSHGAGMAVPDWPTTYGYNMFLFPPSYWIGGIFYEHSHRLFASFVGLLTTILAIWLWVKDTRSWLRWLGVAAFFAVVLQGILGGLRVTLYKDEIGIVHAALAQSFLVLVSLIALFTSSWWRKAGESIRPPLSRATVHTVLIATLLIFGQLVLGATMRHQHAGLAVPDFPLAYGQWWPPLDAASIESFNRQRTDFREFNPITAFQIVLHMAHRMVAAFILVGVCVSVWKVNRSFAKKNGFTRAANLWLGLIVAQAGLGIATILSAKAADVATLHVVGGAASLVLGALLAVCLLRVSVPASVPVGANPITTGEVSSSRGFAAA